MKKYLRRLFENYHIIALLSFLFIMLVLHQNLYLCEDDDNFYNVIAKCDFSKIFEFLKWHYNFKNGRMLVHFALLATLKFDIYLWRITNPIVFTLLVYFTGRIVSDVLNNDVKKSITLSVIFYLVVDYSYITSSVYWVSSSFNYLLPMLTVLLTIFFFNKKNFVLTLVFAFLSGFATEQSSMIIIGFFVLVSAYKLIFQRDFKITKEVICLVVSIIGLYTILSCPAVDIRMENSSSGNNLMSLVNRFIDILYLNWFATEKAIAIVALLTGSIALVIYNDNAKSYKMKRFNVIVSFLMIFACVANLLNIIVFDNKLVLIYYTYLLVLTLGIVYSSLLLFFKQKQIFPVIMLALGIGSQLMMSVTNAWVFRTCFPGIVCFSLYVLWVCGFYMQRILNKRSIMIVVCIFALLLVFRNVYGNINYINSVDEKIESYCKNEATLEDYNYVLTDQETGTFWYKNIHEEFFKEKIKIK